MSFDTAIDCHYGGRDRVSVRSRGKFGLEFVRNEKIWNLVIALTAISCFPNKSVICIYRSYTVIVPLQSGRSILEYQNQAKMLFRKLGPQSPARCTLETGPYLFQWVIVVEYVRDDFSSIYTLFIPYMLVYSYLIENEVCYLVLCERNYSARVAYSYLEDIAQEFYAQYGKRVNTVTRPYTFIEFGMSALTKCVANCSIGLMCVLLTFQIHISRKPEKSSQMVDPAEI